MTDKKKPFLTRAEHSKQKVKGGKFQKMDRLLNILIGLVAVLIMISLFVILNTKNNVEKSDDEQQAEQQEQQEDQPDTHTEAGVEDEQQQPEQTPQQEEEAPQSETIVTPSNDTLVKEIHTNPDWQPYSTQQTGTHTSTFEEGHIDYEEKLAVIFSVTELIKDSSIVWSVRNNGNAESAIAVVSSMDKALKYRVSIEWVDEQGWKPVKLEVLNALEGSY